MGLLFKDNTPIMEFFFFCLQVLCPNLAAILSLKHKISVNRIVLAQMANCFHQFLNYAELNNYSWKINSYQ
jgi:hypothetical protein